MGKSIVKNLQQLFLIVFSVILGIYLSERIEERKNEKEAALLLSKIKSEVETNQKILEDWVPYHIAVVRRLDSLSNNETFISQFVEDESALFRQVLTRGSLMGSSPSNDAWDIAKSHPLIVHFDYEDLLILSKIYNQQIMAYSSVPKVVEILLSADFNAAEKAKTNLRAFTNLMREIVSRENQLLDYIAQSEKILE